MRLWAVVASCATATARASITLSVLTLDAAFCRMASLLLGGAGPPFSRATCAANEAPAAHALPHDLPRDLAFFGRAVQAPRKPVDEVRMRHPFHERRVEFLKSETVYCRNAGQPDRQFS